MRNAASPLAESGFIISGILAVILLTAIISLFVLACDERDTCYDCRILTVFHIYDTTIICDTVQKWCDIDPDFFESINSYYAEYPDQGFTVNQVVNCK